MSTLDDKIAADVAAQNAAIAATPTDATLLSHGGEQLPFASSEAPEPQEGEAAPDVAETEAEAAKEAPEPQEAANDETAAKEAERERFKRMRLEAKEAKRRTAELEARLAAIEAGQAPPYDEAMLNKRAEEIATAKAFNAEANKIAKAGEKAFPDFKEAIEELWETVGIQSAEDTVPWIEAAIEAGDSHKVLHYLGTNPEEAERLARLSPVRRGVEIGKIGAKLSAPAPKPVSKAPAPIQPVINTPSAPAPDMMKMSMAEYMKMEDQKLKARFGR